MDPRHRADEALSRARSRGAFVVTPDNATSPMDAASTVRISREVVSGLGGENQHSTVQLQKRNPQAGPSQQAPSQQASQQTPPQQPPSQQQVPQPPQQSGTQQSGTQQAPPPQGPPQQPGAQQGNIRPAPSTPRDTRPLDTTAWPTEDPQKPGTQFPFPQEFPR